TTPRAAASSVHVFTGQGPYACKIGASMASSITGEEPLQATSIILEGIRSVFYVLPAIPGQKGAGGETTQGGQKPTGRCSSPVFRKSRFCYHASREPQAMAHNRKDGDAEDGIKLICRNKRAFHEYLISDRLECGIVLTGTEVKSLREGRSSLEEAYAKVEN